MIAVLVLHLEGSEFVVTRFRIGLLMPLLWLYEQELPAFLLHLLFAVGVGAVGVGAVTNAAAGSSIISDSAMSSGGW